ncbi:hypothetical protein P152DRAFT_452669 [Eremomyces bilateralis CBS 781.70]|uniref:Uncharacterized protein n=1 Tax=Eremomyces bilateralis CBS 781.70 TaxID=1392243 RepID=A0A6G1FSL3_9PEZI|nr:uncharacterized protein P152DRAFT_452669 [Eremomyces bilateralis CBS 781.70]KAF1808726.1 hypothetical protein P152DRAFT_452669 [Eremomyces bilateralis CBS 781.70]
MSHDHDRDRDGGKTDQLVTSAPSLGTGTRFPEPSPTIIGWPQGIRGFQNGSMRRRTCSRRRSSKVSRRMRYTRRAPYRLTILDCRDRLDGKVTSQLSSPLRGARIDMHHAARRPWLLGLSMSNFQRRIFYPMPIRGSSITPVLLQYYSSITPVLPQYYSSITPVSSSPPRLRRCSAALLSWIRVPIKLTAGPGATEVR